MEALQSNQWKDYDVSSFVKEYHRLLSLEGAPNPMLEAAHFIVMGYNKPANHHARLETLVHAMSESSHCPGSHRDINSLSGFSDEIPVQTDLFIHPVPASYDSLTMSLGMKIPFNVNNTVSKISLLTPMCSVLNISLLHLLLLSLS